MKCLQDGVTKPEKSYEGIMLISGENLPANWAKMDLSGSEHSSDSLGSPEGSYAKLWATETSLMMGLKDGELVVYILETVTQCQYTGAGSGGGRQLKSMTVQYVSHCMLCAVVVLPSKV